MKIIHFIINPIAGSGNHTLSTNLLKSHFNKNSYSIKIKFSKYKGHSKTLAQESITDGAKIIVACGGDGTINEVARFLVNTSVVLGIIPMGSGNGLASNLDISKNINKAIRLIKSENIHKIDVGKINNHFFFSNTGIGFDAKVIKHYEASKKRKLLAYVKATLKTLIDFKYDNGIEIKFNDKTIRTELFMFFVSNSNKLGYKVSLTPSGSLQDGLLDVFLVDKINKLKMIALGILIMIKKQYLMKQVQHHQTKQITIKHSKNKFFKIQVDGESLLIKDKIVEISILEKALHVISAKTTALV